MIFEVGGGHHVVIYATAVTYLVVSYLKIPLRAIEARSPLLQFDSRSNSNSLMSRIFIRGLPPNLTAEEFKRHFSKQKEITDAKFIPHRRIGYVGFKSNEDAANAVKYHHKTFIRMSRISVELARSVRDLLNKSSH